jgi:hypothetical protein
MRRAFFVLPLKVTTRVGTSLGRKNAGLKAYQIRHRSL